MDKTTISVYLQSDSVLNSRYIVHKRIASGSFGSVFLVTNRETQKQMALKLELLKGSAIPFLKKEWTILKMLEGVKGIPRMYNSGKTEKLAFLQIDLLNKDLSHIIKEQSNTDTQFLSEIASKLFRIFAQVHSLGILHRDIKPHNIMLDKNNQVYLIDFGISKCTQSGRKQISTKKNRFVGTPRYSSVAAHEKSDQTPKDDIESLLYVLVFLFKKELPWINLPQKLGHKTDEILKTKLKTSRKALCAGLPSCFLEAFNHIDKLSDYKQIDYEYLSLIFLEENRPFPKIRVHFEDEMIRKHTPKISGARRAVSHISKNKENLLKFGVLQEQQKRISLQQSNLLRVPTLGNLENSSSSNYDSEANITQRALCECLSQTSTEQIEKDERIDTSKFDKNLDEQSTTQESVALKLEFYSMMYPSQKMMGRRKQSDVQRHT